MEQPGTAGILRRIAAIGYDSLLVFSLLFGATGIYHLIASTLHSLAPEEQARLDVHLQECPDCHQKLLALQEDDRRLTAYVEATDLLLTRADSLVKYDADISLS